MNVLCSAVHVALPTVGEAAITGPLAAHVDSCMPCRGEVLRYRQMYRELDALEIDSHRAPSDLTNQVVANLGPVALVEHEPRRDNRLPVAAAVVATAAAGTAVLYKIYRDRAA
ncbi:MAG: hypothetical protein ABFR95_06910 [Actinomycetota bacterium]